MHVTIINGSQRWKPGFTAELLAEFADGVGEAGGTTETLDLARLGLKPCIACGACQKAGAGHCVAHQGDGAESAFEAIRRADVVVYASPIYVFTISSLLKSLIERFYGIGSESSFIVTESGLLFHETDRAVCGKPFVAVFTCDNSECETTLGAERYFRTFSRFLDAPLLGTLVRGGGRFIRAGKAAVSLEEVHASFRRAGVELVRDGRISRRTERKARRSALPVPAFLLGMMKRTMNGRRLLVARAGA
jgi:multimeric flavodoxin WrbA